MHTLSLPPTDRDLVPEPFLAGDALVAAVKATGASHSEICTGIGKSQATVSLVLNRKYTGDNAAIENLLREWLRNRNLAIVSGVATVETETSEQICHHLEDIRQNQNLGIILGPAGIGKSRAQSIYLQNHSLAIAFRVCTWHSGPSGLADDLCRAADINRIKRGQRRWEVICEKTKDSGRLLIVDDAHELTQRGLQCCVDWHERTGNPVALVGLPQLQFKLLKDSRRARRVGEVYTIKLPTGSQLVEHLIDSLASDANGDRNSLLQLCSNVASQVGHYGAVEKQLKLAARIRKKTHSSWVDAFRGAHKRLLRPYSLPDKSPS